MTTLKTTIYNDLKAAMKAKDAQKLSTLRMLKAVIEKKEIEKRSELTDEETLSAVQKEIKSYKESLEAFTIGNRVELVEETKSRLKDLEVYVPAQLTKEEITEIVSSLINELNIQGPKEKGKLMKDLMPKVKGKADGKLVNEVVTELLNK